MDLRDRHHIGRTCLHIINWKHYDEAFKESIESVVTIASALRVCLAHRILKKLMRDQTVYPVGRCVGRIDGLLHDYLETYGVSLHDEGFVKRRWNLLKSIENHHIAERNPNPFEADYPATDGEDDSDTEMLPRFMAKSFAIEKDLFDKIVAPEAAQLATLERNPYRLGPRTPVDRTIKEVAEWKQVTLIQANMKETEFRLGVHPMEVNLGFGPFAERLARALQMLRETVPYGNELDKELKLFGKVKPALEYMSVALIEDRLWHYHYKPKNIVAGLMDQIGKLLGMMQWMEEFPYGSELTGSFVEKVSFILVEVTIGIFRLDWLLHKDPHYQGDLFQTPRQSRNE